MSLLSWIPGLRNERSEPVSNWREFIESDFVVRVLTLLFVGILLGVAFAPYALYSIRAGQVGVLYNFYYGTEVSKIYGEGLHLFFPLNHMNVYEVRMQTVRRQVNVLSYNGLTVEVTLACRFKVIPEEAGYLHQEIGPEYLERLVTPTLFAATREVVGNYSPEELYTTHSTTLQHEIDRVVQASSQGHHVHFFPVLVEKLKLPGTVNDAIEEKLQLKQEAQSYEFRLAKESQEKERKRIEALGIQKYNDTIDQSLSSEILTMNYIQALRELATGSNSKVVVLGSGGSEDGIALPIFMNQPLEDTDSRDRGPQLDALGPVHDGQPQREQGFQPPREQDPQPDALGPAFNGQPQGLGQPRPGIEGVPDTPDQERP